MSTRIVWIAFGMILYEVYFIAATVHRIRKMEADWESSWRFRWELGCPDRIVPPYMLAKFTRKLP